MNALEAAGSTLAHAMGVAANEAASALYPAAEWVCNQTCKEECSDWSQTCKTILKGRVRSIRDSRVCLERILTETQMPDSTNAHGVQLRPPSALPANGEVRQEGRRPHQRHPRSVDPRVRVRRQNRKIVPLKTSLLVITSSKKPPSGGTKENSPNNPGAIWFNHGWGDQMGITSIGFMCPEGSHYARIGKKDMPESTSQSRRGNGRRKTTQGTKTTASSCRSTGRRACTTLC